MGNIVVVILDSCRYDLYVEADTSFLDSLGKPSKAYTSCNFTLPSFVSFFDLGWFPQPCPRGFPFKRSIDVLSRFKEYYKVMVTGMPMLSGVFPSVRGIARQFDRYVFLDRMQVCEYGVKMYNRLRDRCDRLLFVLWTGETHHPYEVDGDPTDWRKEEIELYNRGADTLSEDYLDYLKSRQRKMIEYCDRVLKNLKLDGDVFILTADHGESIGENHKIGHGNDIHRVQFEVPLIYVEL